MTQDLNEQFINPELQDIQEPLTGPTEASLFELDAITNTEFGKVEEDDTFMQDKQAKDIYESLKPIATETKSQGYLVDDKVYTELPKEALETLRSEKIPDPPTEEEKQRKAEEFRVQKEADIEALRQEAFERNPGEDSRSTRRRERQIKRGTEDIEKKYKNDYEAYLKDTNMSYIKDNNPTVKQVKATDYIVQKDLKATTKRWNKILNGEYWKRVSTYQGDDAVPEYEDRAQQTLSKGIYSIEKFVDAFEKDNVKEGDVFRGFTLYGYNSNTMTPFAKPLYYQAAIDGEGKKIVQKVKDVDGIYDPVNKQFIPVANYKKVTPININYKYDTIVNYDDRVSDIEKQVTDGTMSRVDADIKIKTLGDERSKLMSDVKTAYSGLMSDKKTPDWLKLVLTASTYTNEFEQKWAEINKEAANDDEKYDRLLKAIGGIFTSPLITTALVAEGGEYLLKEGVRLGLGKEEAKISNGVLALEIKKNPEIVNAMQKVLDEAGGRKGKYLNSIQGMADLVDEAKIRLDNKDIETIGATLMTVLPELQNVIGGFKEAKTDLEISKSLIEAGMLKIQNQSGYSAALKEFEDGYNALSNSNDKNVRDAVRYIKLQSFLMEKGSNYKDRYASLKEDDVQFLNTTAKELLLNSPDVVESTHEQLLKLEQVGKRAKELFPEKELKAFVKENMTDFEGKVNSYNQSLKIFNESALFSERGKFVLNRLHELSDRYESKYNDTYMYSFPFLSPLAKESRMIPNTAAFALVKVTNTIRGMLEGIRETGTKLTSFNWTDYNPNAANVSASIKEYKNRLETSVDTNTYAGKIIGQISEALPQMLAFSASFIAGGPLGGFAYIAATETGRSMREAADAGLTGLEQVVYSQIKNGIEVLSERITTETSLFGFRGGRSVLTKDLVKRIMAPQTRAQAIKEYAKLFVKRSGKVVASGALEYLEEEVADKANAILQNTFNTLTNATFNPTVFTAQQSLDMLITMIGTSAIFRGGTKVVQNMRNRGSAQEEIRKQLVKNQQLNITKEEAFVISALTQKENIAPVLKIIQEVEAGNIKESELNLPVYEMVRDVWLPAAMSMNFSPNTTLQQRTVALDNIAKAKEISTMVENGEVTQQEAAPVIEMYMQNADKAMKDTEYAEQQFAIEPTEMKTLIYDYFGLSDTMVGSDGILDARTEEQKQAAQAEEVDMTPLDRMSFANRLRDIYVTNEKNSNAARANEASIAASPETFLAAKVQNTKDLIEKAKADYEFALQNDMPYAARVADIENLNQRLRDLETIKSRYLNSQQYATEVSTRPQQEGGQPSDIIQPTGVEQGQQEIRQGEGGVGQAAQQAADARNRNFGSQAQQVVQDITGLPDNTPVIQNYTRTINPGQEVQLMDELAQQVVENEQGAVRQMGQPVVDRIKQWITDTNYTAPVPVIPPAIAEANNRVVEARNALIDAINQSNATSNTANKSSVKTLVERLKKAFPNVKVIMDKKGFQAALKDEAARDLMTKGGVVYGRILNGDVYLNPDYANYNTPIHEFGHLWLNAAKEIAPDVYNRGLELIRDSEYMAKLQADPLYQGLSAEEMENEALATAIGDRGEQFVNEAQKQGFRSWMRRLLRKMAQYVGIFNLSKVELDLLTLDEYLNRANASLLAGETISFGNLQTVRDITVEDTFMARQESFKSQMIDLANAVMQREMSKGRTLDEARVIATSEVSAAVIANSTGKFNSNAVQRQIERYVEEAYNERKIAEQAAARQRRISQAYTNPQAQAILADANKTAQDIAAANVGNRQKTTPKQAYDTILAQVKAAIDRMYANGTVPAGVSWIDMMSLAPAIASDAVRASFPQANRQIFEGEEMVTMSTSQWIRNAVSNQIRAIRDVKDRAKKIEEAVKAILKDFQNRYGRGVQLTTGQIKAIIKDLNDNIFSRDDIMTAVDKGAAEISKVIEKAYRKKVLSDVQKAFDRLQTASSTKYSGEYFNKVKAILSFPLSELAESSATLEDLSKLNGHIKDIVALKLDSIQDALDILNSISPSNQQKIADEHKSLLTKIKDLITKANTQTLSMLDYKKMMELRKAVEDVKERKNNISALTPQQQAEIMQQYGILTLTDLGDINRIIADKEQDIKRETTALVGQIKTELEDDLSDIRTKIPNGVLYQQFLSFMNVLSDDYLSNLSPTDMLNLSSALSQVYDYGNYSNMVYEQYIKALRWKQRDGAYRWGTEIAGRRNEITGTGLTGFVQEAMRKFARTFTDVEGATPSADAISRNLDLLKITSLDYELYNGFDRLNMGYLEREIFGPMAASIDAAMIKTQSKLGQLQTAMIALTDKSNHASIKKAIGNVLKTYDVSGSMLGLSLRNKMREGRAASFLNDISVRMAAIVAHQIDHISNDPAIRIDRVLQRNIFEVKPNPKGEIVFMEGTMFDYFTKGGISFKSLEGNNNKFMDAIAYAALTNGGTTTLREKTEAELMDLLTDKQKEGIMGWREHINQNRETFEAAQVIVGNMGASVKNYFPIRVYGDKAVTDVTDPMAYLNGQFSNLGIDKGQTISRTGETGNIDLDANKVLLHNMKALNLMVEVMPFLQQIKGLGDAINDVKTAKDVNEFSAAYLKGINKNLTERLNANLSHNERVVNDDLGYTFRLMSSAQSFAARVWLISVTRQLFADFPANIGKLTSALGFENRRFGNQILQLLSPKKSRYTTDTGTYKWDDYVEIANLTGSPVYKVMSLYADNFLYEFKKTPEQLQRQQRVASWQDMAVKKHGWMSRFEEAFKRITGEYLDHNAFKDERGVYRASNMDAVMQASAVADSFTDRQFSLPSFTRQPLRRQLLAPFLGRGIRNMFDTDKRKISLAKDNPLAILTGFLQGYPTTQHQLYNSYIKLAFSTRSGLSFGKRTEYLTRAILEGIVPSITYSIFRSYMGVLYLSTAAAVYAAAGEDDDPKAVENKIKELDKKEGWDKYIQTVKTGLKAKTKSVKEVIINGIASTAIDPQTSFFLRTSLGLAAFHLYKEDATEKLLTMNKSQRKKAMMLMRQKEASWFNLYNVKPIEIYGGKTYDEAMRAFYSAEEPTKGWEDLVNSFSGISAIHGLATTVHDIRRYYAASGEGTSVNSKDTAIAAGLTAYGYIFANMMVGGKFGFFLNMISGDLRNIGTKIFKEQKPKVVQEERKKEKKTRRGFTIFLEPKEKGKKGGPYGRKRGIGGGSPY